MKKHLSGFEFGEFVQRNTFILSVQYFMAKLLKVLDLTKRTATLSKSCNAEDWTLCKKKV